MGSAGALSGAKKSRQTRDRKERLAGRRVPSADRVRRLEETLAKLDRLATDEAYLVEFPSVTNQTMRIRRELNDTGFVGRFEKRFIENPSSIAPRDMRDWHFFAGRLHDIDHRPEKYAHWLRDVVKAFGHWHHTHRWYRGYGSDRISKGGFSPEWLEKSSLPYLYLALSVLAEAMNRFETANDKRFEAAWIVFHYPAISPWVSPGTGRNYYGGRPVSDRLAVGLSVYDWWCTDGPN